ncbi:efflux RND transporter periplasmic adaptor subunit [Enterococcus sp. AZ072]|uniref:efflux RND transporter periplasmic adaptor subunit n=1 Tax=unclassified Enterococcus TaxID=2608891 RepID=UPI003D2C98E5
MKKKTKIFIASVAGLVIAGCGFAALRSGKQEPQYSAYTVKTADPLQLKGKVEPIQKRLYFLDTSKGAIKNITVTNGQEVSEGTPLLEYQNDTAQNELITQQHAVNKSSLDASQSEAAVASSEKQAQTLTNQVTDTQQKIARTQDQEEKAGLNEQLKQQQAELQAANDQLSQARFAVQGAYEDIQAAKDVLAGQQQQASTTVNAEIAGIVSVEEKGQASPEVPVVTISEKNKQIKGIVTEYDLDKLVPGQAVQVSTIGDNQQAEGKVKSIASSAIVSSNDNNNVASYEFIVEGDFPWSDDLSTVVTLKQDQLILPDAAIKEKGGKHYVFKYTNGKVKQTEIQIQEVNGHKIVQNGLKAKDQIIENPDDELKDGAEVQVSAND